MSDPTLEPTPIIDSDNAAVIAFAQRADGGTDREVAVSLFYAVRDGYRYDPYRIDVTPTGMRASTVLAKGYGWCVTKATLLAAACRARGIPARLGFADVRNHLSTERMRQVMGTDIFYWHGFTEIRLEDRWIKATPAFNIELCERFGFLPLEFDGRSDSIYHPFDTAGHRHMEYVRQRGSFDDVPLADIVADFTDLYPAWQDAVEAGGDFLNDVAAENRG
ncbi:MAG: transglutaminase family protein [Candidatus Nanopelagicales bacterium]|jgi:transglutaminase-like putative cysteine protease|nr:transglutaminase family protein [Candidatus Nanopelagicales bacterium]